MSDQVRPEEAARALTEIGRRQEQVIRLTLIPNWYWWAIAILMVGFTAAVETRQGLAIGIGTSLFVVGVLAVTARIVAGAVRRAQPRNDLLGPSGVFAILGFVALTVGASLAVAFTLDAFAVEHAATAGVATAGIMEIIGGPILMRYLQRLMLANRAGSR